MKHSIFWALIIVVFWTLIGCSSGDRKHTVTIVISEGNSLVYKKRGQSEPIKYGSGDRVVLVWERDTCYVNGQMYRPWPPAPPKIVPLERLKELYGTIPFFLEYVRGHSGDEAQVWNKAYYQWEKLTSQLVTEAIHRYRSELQHGQSPDAAAESAVVVLRASPMVTYAAVDERSRYGPPTPNRCLFIRYAGEKYGGGIFLEARPWITWPPRQTMNLEELKSFVRLMHNLEGKGRVTIELSGEPPSCIRR